MNFLDKKGGLAIWKCSAIFKPVPGISDPLFLQPAGVEGRRYMDIDSVKKAYRRYAPRYDIFFGALLAQGRRKAVERMNCRPRDVVLEVGVGTGLSLPLYCRSVRIFGIDVSREMLERARLLKERKGLENVVALEEMDAEEMTFPDETFDKVVAMYVVSVAPNPLRLVREMQRVCKPGGEIFIVNHFRHGNPVIASFERLVAPLSRVIGFKPDFSLEEFLAATGLKVEESIPVNLFGYWSMLRVVNQKEAEVTYLPLRAARRA